MSILAVNIRLGADGLKCAISESRDESGSSRTDSRVRSFEKKKASWMRFSPRK